MPLGTQPVSRKERSGVMRLKTSAEIEGLLQVQRDKASGSVA